MSKTKFFTHINRGVIDANTKRQKADPTAAIDPPVTYRKGKHGKGVYGNEIAIYDDQGNEVARVVYSPDKPLLPCGARMVIVSENEPKVIR